MGRTSLRPAPSAAAGEPGTYDRGLRGAGDDRAAAGRHLHILADAARVQRGLLAEGRGSAAPAQRASQYRHRRGAAAAAQPRDRRDPRVPGSVPTPAAGATATRQLRRVIRGAPRHDLGTGHRRLAARIAARIEGIPRCGDPLGPVRELSIRHPDHRTAAAGGTQPAGTEQDLHRGTGGVHGRAHRQPVPPLSRACLQCGVSAAHRALRQPGLQAADDGQRTAGGVHQRAGAAGFREVVAQLRTAADPLRCATTSRNPAAPVGTRP